MAPVRANSTPLSTGQTKNLEAWWQPGRRFEGIRGKKATGRWARARLRPVGKTRASRARRFQNLGETHN